MPPTLDAPPLYRIVYLHDGVLPCVHFPTTCNREQSVPIVAESVPAGGRGGWGRRRHQTSVKKVKKKLRCVPNNRVPHSPVKKVNRPHHPSRTPGVSLNNTRNRHHRTEEKERTWPQQHPTSNPVPPPSFKPATDKKKHHNNKNSNVSLSSVLASASTTLHMHRRNIPHELFRKTGHRRYPDYCCPFLARIQQLSAPRAHPPP